MQLEIMINDYDFQLLVLMYRISQLYRKQLTSVTFVYIPKG